MRIQQKEDYIIPIHEFSKAAVLGDFSHFVPNSSIAMNLFDVESIDRREHFICMMIVSFLIAPNQLIDRDGFFRSEGIIDEMQKWGFLPDQVTRALRRLTNKKLIETTERVTFEEDLTGLVGEMPEGFRYTAVGAYHLRRWAGTFGYVEGMSLDTPIFDPAAREKMSFHVESFEIADRFNRALVFRDYLSETWDASNLRPSYFDWHDAVRLGDGTFATVRRVIARNAHNDNRN